MTRLLMLGACCLVMNLCAAQKITDLKLTDTIPLDPAVRYGRLENGLTYYIQNSGKGNGEISMNLVVNAGLVQEDSDQMQISHLIEHIAMFRATKHFPQSPYKYGQLAGFQQLRGSTGFTATRYEFVIPEGKKALIDSGFLVLYDLAQGSLLNPKEVDAERGAVMGEIRESESYHWRMNKQKEFALLKSPMYAVDMDKKRYENLRDFPQAAIERYYKEWYRPDIEALIIVGDIDEQIIEEKIKALFNTLILPSKPLRNVEWQERYAARFDGKNNIIRVSDKDMQNITLELYTKQRAKTYLGNVSTPGGYRLLLIDELYNLMIIPRMEQITLRYNPPAQQAINFIERRAIQAPASVDVITSHITLDTRQSIKNALQLSLKVLECVKRNGFSQQEFDSAKNNLLVKYADDNEVALYQDYLVSKYIDHFRYRAAAPSLKEKRELFRHLLNQITLESINSFAQTWLNNSTNNDLVISTPLNFPVPSDTELKGWMAEADSSSSGAVQCQVNNSRVELPVNISAGSKQPKYTISEKKAAGITELKMENGIRVVLKSFVPEGYSSDKILLQAINFTGASNYQGADHINALCSGAIIENSGTGGLDKFELQRFGKEKSLGVMLSVNENYTNITGYSSLENLEEMLKLIRLYITDPNKNEEAFTDWRYNRGNMPRNVMIEFEKYIREKRGVRTSAATDEMIKKVDFEQAYRIYKELYSDAGNFAYIITGNFKPEGITPLLLKYLGSLPAKNNTTIKKSAGIKATAPNKQPLPAASYSMYNGTEKSASVRLIFDGRYQPDPVKDFQLRILEKILDVLVFERVRVKEGGVYYISATIRPDQPESQYSCRIEYACDTSNVEKLIAAALEEVQRLRTNGPSQDLTNRVKAMLQQKYEENLKSNDRWYEYLVSSYLNNYDPEFISRIPQLIKELTPETIRQIAHKYLDEKGFSRFVLYPEQSVSSGK